MSWVVETLLKQRHQIRAEQDLESDLYSDILIVEKKVEDLVEQGVIDGFELALLNYVSDNLPFSDLEVVLGINRNTISEHFRRICDRISYALGGEFTDEGKLAEMRTKYKLTKEQVEKMREHMGSKYKYTIRRKA